MPQAIFAYHLGMDAEQYAFFRIPKLLITEPYFRRLSTDAKLLYGLMLDRMSLSMRNGWMDDDGHVYIYFTLEEACEQLCCKTDKAVKLFAELDSAKGVGLIRRVKQGLQPLLDPSYEAHAFGTVQLREQLDRLIRLAAELFARLLQRKVDIHMAIIVHPAVSHGQAHAVQHEAVQQLRVGGEPPKVRLGDQELGDAEKGVLLGVHAEMVRKDRLRHI